MGFTAKYGFVGGMSEVGMAVNEHTLDLAVFQTPSPAGANSTLCTRDFPSWVMGTMGSIAEMREALPKLNLVGGGGIQWGVQDAFGQSVVVEYIKGVLNLHNNSVGRDNTGIGVMTNDPTWDWHLQNLNNFAALQPGWYGNNNDAILRNVPAESNYPWATNAYDNKPPKVPTPMGHAYNLAGLPGDGSPPARFVRTFFLRGYAMLQAPPKDIDDTCILAQELLNSVYKVLGTVASRNADDPLETTPTSSIKVISPTLRQVFYRSREDMTWRMLDLTVVNFLPSTAGSKVAHMTTGSFSFINVTSELQ
jgi:choloylglycine hydrolase